MKKTDLEAELGLVIEEYLPTVREKDICRIVGEPYEVKGRWLADWTPEELEYHNTMLEVNWEALSKADPEFAKKHSSKVDKIVLREYVELKQETEAEQQARKESSLQLLNEHYKLFGIECHQSAAECIQANHFEEAMREQRKIK